MRRCRKSQAPEWERHAERTHKRGAFALAEDTSQVNFDARRQQKENHSDRCYCFDTIGIGPVVGKEVAYMLGSEASEHCWSLRLFLAMKFRPGRRAARFSA